MIDLTFWVKINFDGPIVRADLGPCWLFERNIDKGGYAHYCKWDKDLGRARRHLAHRYAYKQFFGDIPPELDHECGTTNCVNPWHTNKTTHRDNLAKSNCISTQHAKQTVCHKGHPLRPRYDRKDWRFCVTCRNERARINYHKRKGEQK